ncbi:DedA family protein [Streptomyces niger]|uniref:DedA family protein n=1 Tax=Streptomyces niger TaxID=66373 RepID=UPI000A5F6D6F
MNTLAVYGLLALTTAPPLVPNAALLAWAGVLAADGDLHLALVLPVVAGSALLGDLLLHLAARRFGRPARAWMGRRARRRAFLERTSLLVDRYGVPFVAGVRFLPAGRVAAALVTGVVRYPVRRYLLGCAIAETLWASYSVGVGYLGTTATHSFVPALALSIGLSALVCGATALVQHVALRHLAVRSAQQVEAGEGGEDKGETGEEGAVEAVDAAAAEVGAQQDGGQENGVQ